MNYAALLGVVAAAAFTLPGLALLAESLGLHRNAGVATSLGVAVLTAVWWFVRARRAGRSSERERPLDGPPTLATGTSSPAEMLNVKEEAGAQH